MGAVQPLEVVPVDPASLEDFFEALAVSVSSQDQTIETMVEKGQQLTV